MMDFFNTETIQLSFRRLRFSKPITGLTVSVQVINNQTNTILLPTTNLPEISPGAAVYAMMWTHGLTQDTTCLARYAVGSDVYEELFKITFSGFGGRGT